MPGTRRAYLNDNVRTAHLKCAGCRTQVYLIRIEQDDGGGETRTFRCPHCLECKSISLAPLPHFGGRTGEMAQAGDPVIC